MKHLVFRNQGQLSVLDLTTMGDSIKREDDSKIGKFDSGLKYALAILYRNNVNFRIDLQDRYYTISSTTLTDVFNDKSKEVLVIKEHIDLQLEDPELDSYTCVDHITGFSPQLGYNWEFWMVIRELWCNCLDEGGTKDIYYSNNGDVIPIIRDNETVITILVDDKVQEVLDNWDNYFLKEDLVIGYNDSSDESLEIHNNTSNYLKIYKQGVLVYEDKNQRALYSYNHKSLQIDEMRRYQLNSCLERDIKETIAMSDNYIFVNTICNSSGFESTLDYDFTDFSETWKEVVNGLYTIGKLNVSKNLLKRFAQLPEFEVGKKALQKPNSSYSWETTLIEIPKEVDADISFDGRIKSIISKFNLDVDYPIVESFITGFKVIGDARSKTLYVNSDFTIDDMWELILGIYTIEGKDIKDTCKELVKLKTK